MNNKTDKVVEDLIKTIEETPIVLFVPEDEENDFVFIMDVESRLYD